MDWLVIGRTHFSKEKKSSSLYEVKEGDIIKIGKIMFKIREAKPLLDSKKDNLNNETDVNDRLKSIYIKSQLSNTKKNNPLKSYLCRICLNESTNDSTTNPLINPCNCTGSVRYIHLECLRQWLSSKITIKSTYDSMVTAFSFKEFECEICKSQIPHQIKVNNEIISLINIGNCSPPYLVLESIPHSFHVTTNSKDSVINIYIIRFGEKKNEIKIGRSNDAELRLSDISVSRSHSTFVYKNNTFYLEDNRSKFGTLLLIQNEMMFLPYKPLSIQIGKFHLSFKLSRTLISWLKCYRNKQICKLNYDQILKSMKMIIYEDELKNIKSVTYTDDELYTPENIKSFINDGSIETENNAGNSSNLRLVDEDVEKRIEIIFKKIRTEKIYQSKKKTSNTSIMANNTKNQLVIMDTEGGGGVTARELH